MSWWTNIFGEPKEADEWRMCKVLETTYVNTHRDNHGVSTETKVALQYYLYENQHGDRKFDVADSMKGDYKVTSVLKNDIIFRLKMYRQTVKPWLDGRLDPEIPTYESIPRRDFKRALTKKK